MIYADTDLFLAILKSFDWYKENANEIMEPHKIETSETTNIELTWKQEVPCISVERMSQLLSKKYNLDFIYVIKEVMVISQ